LLPCAEWFNRQSREDLREDRRIDFLLSQLIDIAAAVEPGALNSADVPVIRAKIRALPWDMLPVLRAHVDVWPTDSGRERYAPLMRAGQERGTLDPGGPSTQRSSRNSKTPSTSCSNANKLGGNAAA
jgi:hypothetical protein